MTTDKKKNKSDKYKPKEMGFLEQRNIGTVVGQYESKNPNHRFQIFEKLD